MGVIAIFLNVSMSIYLLIGILIWLTGFLQNKFRTEKFKAFLFLMILWPLYLYIKQIK
jgi:hypothetical protein